MVSKDIVVGLGRKTLPSGEPNPAYRGIPGKVLLLAEADVLKVGETLLLKGGGISGLDPKQLVKFYNVGADLDQRRIVRTANDPSAKLGKETRRGQALLWLMDKAMVKGDPSYYAQYREALSEGVDAGKKYLDDLLDSESELQPSEDEATAE